MCWGGSLREAVLSTLFSWNAPSRLRTSSPASLPPEDIITITPLKFQVLPTRNTDVARECSWVTPHLSYQSTHELHLYIVTVDPSHPT